MTNNIIFIKSLFCPNQTYLNITMKSIHNNINYFLQMRIDIKIILIGWILEEYKEKIRVLIKGTKFDIEFIPWNNNLGKITLYHRFNNLAKNYKYILYSDHDILFDFKHTNFDCVFAILDNLFNKHNFGLLSLNQMGDCRHQTTLIENENIYDNIKILVSSNKNDIGGGCFVIENIDLIKPNYNHVYGFDEIYLMSCFKDKKSGVLLDYYVIHPQCKEDELFNYKDWKKKNVLKNLNTFDKQNNLDYIIQINESHKFWNTNKDGHDPNT